MNLKHLQAALAIAFALFPLAGVLVWKWDLREVVLIYWIENLIIGLWQLVKMASARKAKPIGRLFLMLFFTVHYGIFCLVHGVFIIAMTSFESFSNFGPSGGFPTVETVTGLLSNAAKVAVLLNFLMHGVDVVRSYFISGDYREADPGRLMAAVYGHIIVIHVAIIVAGFFVMTFQSAYPLLALIVLGKLAMDLRSIYRASESELPSERGSH